MNNKWYNDVWWKRLIIVLTFPVWIVPAIIAIILLFFFGEVVVNAVEYVIGKPL